MATYLLLLRYTQRGLDHVKSTLGKIDTTRQAFRARGAVLREIYLTMGQYDLVAIMEAPDDETAAQLVLELGSQGNVRTETVRAFNEDELQRIVYELP